jgi:hypothetical protein
LTIEGRVVVALLMLALFAGMTGLAFTFPRDAGFLPLVVGIPGTFLCLAQLVIELRAPRRVNDAASIADNRATIRRELQMFAWIAGYALTILGIGFLPATAGLVFGFLYFDQREKFWLVAVMAAAGVVALYLFFEVTFGVELHPGFLREAIEDWRDGQ